MNINRSRNNVKSLKNYLSHNTSSTDIFCFQECCPESKENLQNCLEEYQVFNTFVNRKGNTRFWTTTFVKKSYSIKGFDSIHSDVDLLGASSCLRLDLNSKPVYIINTHGLPTPAEKFDTPERLMQSKLILDYLKDKKGHNIVGGDFNLMPETQSIKMFEDTGYINLIKEFDIKATRNEIAWKLYPVKYAYCDYVFVTPDIKVSNFSVPNLEISDHLPLELDFELN